MKKKKKRTQIIISELQRSRVKKLDQVIYCNNLYIYTSHGHEIERAIFLSIFYSHCCKIEMFSPVSLRRKKILKLNFKLYITVEKHYRTNKFYDFRSCVLLSTIITTPRFILYLYTRLYYIISR